MAKLPPITRPEFIANAKPVEITIRGQNIGTAFPKVFSKGKDANGPSVGWYYNGKAPLGVNVPGRGEVTVVLQIGMSATVVGSKDLPADVLEALDAAVRAVLEEALTKGK